MADTDLVRREFAKQAASFEDPKYSFGDPRLIDWLIDELPLGASDTVLEVAAGTAHVSRALARLVHQVIAHDLTPEMLQVGRQAADEEQIGNVLFQLGDAAALPFLDGSFDLVLSRFAVHHFTQPGRHVAEMARVCCEKGHVAVMDMICVDEETASEHNELERLRDPSHTEALTEERLTALYQNAGLRLVSSKLHDQALGFERWLAQVTPSEERAAKVRQRLEAEIAGAAATGMRPFLKAGELRFMQRWALLVFIKPRAV